MAQESEIEILYLATAAEFGVVVAVGDVNSALQSLYRAQVKLKNESLPKLSFHPSPVRENEIWIVKSEKVGKPDVKT